MLRKEISDGITSRPVTDYMAEHEGARFWITHDDSLGWSLCCEIKGHTIGLLHSDGMLKRFEEPESCVALFADHTNISEQWDDWSQRIKSAGHSQTFALPEEAVQPGKIGARKPSFLGRQLLKGGLG